MWAIWVKYLLLPALNGCPKCKKSPNLVTLLLITPDKQWPCTILSISLEYMLLMFLMETCSKMLTQIKSVSNESCDMEEERTAIVMLLQFSKHLSIVDEMRQVYREKLPICFTVTWVAVCNPREMNNCLLITKCCLMVRKLTNGIPSCSWHKVPSIWQKGINTIKLFSLQFMAKMCICAK